MGSWYPNDGMPQGGGAPEPRHLYPQPPSGAPAPQAGPPAPPSGPPAWAPGADWRPRDPGTPGPTRPQPPRRGSRGRWRWSGGIGGFLVALLAWGKYLLLIGLKLPALLTLGSMALSFVAYAAFFGPWFALGFVVMIFCHEMGHVIEIRRQGMRASAPLFIPFFGAAIFQRQNATDALNQARIGIAGPIAGTLAATAAYGLYLWTHQPVLLLWAYLGFLVNLFNLIPFGMFDGGWILAVASKWFQLLGAAALLVAVVAFGVSPIILIFAVLSIPAIIARFRNAGSAYYREVPARARVTMSLAWLGLVAFLGVMLLEAHQTLGGAI